MLVLSQNIKLQIRNFFWKIAQSVKDKENVWISHCDMCGRTSFSSLIKVFHTKDGKKLFSKTIKNGTYLLTDHINICQECRYLLPETWVGCRCNLTKNKIKENKICQLTLK